MTRLDYLRKHDKPLGLPDAGPGQYLIDALFEAGPTIPDPMNGDRPMTWLDVWSYGQATQAIAEPWEYRALHDMSRAYFVGRRDGAEPLSIAPVDRITDG